MPSLHATGLLTRVYKCFCSMGMPWWRFVVYMMMHACRSRVLNFFPCGTRCGCSIKVLATASPPPANASAPAWPPQDAAAPAATLLEAALLAPTASLCVAGQERQCGRHNMCGPSPAWMDGWMDGWHAHTYCSRRPGSAEHVAITGTGEMCVVVTAAHPLSASAFELGSLSAGVRGPSVPGFACWKLLTGVQS